MLPKDRLYILGISGGPDSMFLLNNLRREKYKFIVSHINYKKRIDSDRDEKIVRDYCQNYSLPLEVYQVENVNYFLKGNFQDKARKIRYNFFQRLAEKYQTRYIVVAHHFDDHLETYLLQKQRKVLKENDDKIVIYGLKDEEIDKIDWKRGADFSDYHVNNFQYRRPTIYLSVSTLADHEVRKKKIEFEGSSKSRDIEITEIKPFIRADVFSKEGVPKGILLVGPPGNGKTLLAKALAGECNVPFLARSGSEFEEMVVGMGARRVRELFHQARSFEQGCIIFIDEIDSIGRKRYSANNNHTELTLNQLLSELDGFHSRNNIIILAATNSLRVLDSALLRPEEIVSMTRGLSGAQIVNMFNEASILSIRYGKKSIDQEMIFEAYDRVLMGPSLTSLTITPEKKRIIAFHEAGHAIIGLSLPETIVKKITIIPRLSAGGGRASEEIVFGLDYITMGAYDDFKKASSIIRELILHYGMSDLGIIPTQESFFFGEEVPPELPETTKQKIENEREKILNQC
nr:12618_t:CDS:2 [Entrophospora candida]